MNIFLMTLLNAVVINESRLQKLSQNSIWLKLLHFKNAKSTIVDKNFFLDDNGNISAKKELEATIKAYYQPFTNQDEHPQCLYPARYYWLSKKMKLPNYQIINTHCAKLQKWKLLDNTDSISVVFVSGYLGNPASAFGHSFIKINRSGDIENDLFDTSISYGALLPADYSMPEYIFKGITGGYKAAYSDKYYYNQDITYSNEEYRDMWEYRLNLSEDKKRLFLLHAWELMGKKFQYFFLNRNCGYKVSEFLELVYEDKIIDSAFVWYAPIETFYKLKEFHRIDKKIISKVNYIPSKQQQLYAHYSGLNIHEKEIVSEFIENNLTKIPKKFATYTKKEKGNALDFLLAYGKYTFPNKSKHQLLFLRLKFPIREKNITSPKGKIDITEYNKPNYLGLSASKKSINLTWVPFGLEENGYNGLNGDELVVFDTKLSIRKNELKLSKFDLIRIQRLKTKQIPFEEENPFSWSLHIGTDGRNKQDYFGKAGIGLAWQVNNYTKFYSMVDLSIHSNAQKYRTMPKLGLFNNFDKLKVSTSIGYEKDIRYGEAQKDIDLKAQYKINQKFSLFIDYDLNVDENFEFGIKWFY